MTKKKNSRLKHQKDVSFGDTSEEESVNIHGKNCPHVARGIHFGRVKKSLKSSQSVATCNGCSNENKSELEESPEVWLCLQCGYRGCGRTSTNKHGLQHFKTLHSDCHSLVLSTESGYVWCYDCDDEINLAASRVLKQCVEFVMKMASNSVNKYNIPNVKKNVSEESLLTTVIKEETNAQNKEENIPSEKNKKSVKCNKENSQKIPIKGLRNLGNTCFFNAVMQNLNQTPLLYFELKRTCTLLWEIPELEFMVNEIVESHNASTLKLNLPRQLPLSNSMLNFLEQMSELSSSKTEVINPSHLFGEISKKCPQFRHFQQQDSHELLRQLLDGVKQEEIKLFQLVKHQFNNIKINLNQRQKRAILRFFDLENVSPENVDEEIKKQIKAYGSYASHTIVEKVFGGLLLSTVLCEECKGSSPIFEPFMDLSLPLFEEKQENNDQLCGMLDGGKQDHIKPLRNKKTDWDSDGNTPGEYVLSKPKIDTGKMSKHQEKKQKQLAKKEKKKAKNNSRNRKNSLNEQGENSGNNELNEPVKDLNVDRNNENSEKLNYVDPPNEAILDEEARKLVNSEETSPKNNVVLNIEQPSSVVQNFVNIANEKLEISTDSKKMEDNDAIPVSYFIASSAVAIEIPFEDHNGIKHAESEVENVDKSMECETSVTFNGAVSQNIAKDDCLESLKETEEIAHENIEKVIDSTENQEEKFPEIALQSIESIENQEKRAEDIADESNPDDSLRSLTQEFNSSLKITDSNILDINDRMQAFSLQVKDVRIRKDSDHQENLLNSSESADDCGSLKTNYTSPKSSVEESGSFDNIDNGSHSGSEQQTKDWISKTLTTLKPRPHVSPLECSINSCLSHFTKPELLTGSNKFRCESCTNLRNKKTGNKKDAVYTNASKQMLIFSPPAILTLHLKRFQQVGLSLRKVNRFVEFPLTLDLAPFCCSTCSILPHMSLGEDEILYSLYGIVEHSGRLTSGHYTAYVKANKRNFNRTFECQLPLAQYNLEQLLQKFPGIKRDLSENTHEKRNEDSKWFYISDSLVKEVSESDVLKCQAYLLFYERIK